jgi:anti-sigma regulatory factor (Ser/Thr protein kinase)
MLGEAGVSVESALESARLILVDARATLAKLIVHGEVNAEAFEREVGTVLRAAGRNGSPVRVYGEMVDLLWQRGEITATIELERLWNELIAELQFSLVCAYHTAAIGPPEHQHALRQICQLHSAVSSAPGSGLTPAPEAEAHSESSRAFQPHHDAPRAARRFLEATLQDCGHSRTLIDDARLVISELVTNAVMHARSPLSISIRSEQSRVRLAVHDNNPPKPIPRPTTPAAIPTHGLQIVATLASSWGVEPTRCGKTVWAELGPQPAATDRLSS